MRCVFVPCSHNTGYGTSRAEVHECEVHELQLHWEVFSCETCLEKKIFFYFHSSACKQNEGLPLVSHLVHYSKFNFTVNRYGNLLDRREPRNDS